MTYGAHRVYGMHSTATHAAVVQKNTDTHSASYPNRYGLYGHRTGSAPSSMRYTYSKRRPPYAQYNSPSFQRRKDARGQGHAYYF